LKLNVFTLLVAFSLAFSAFCADDRVKKAASQVCDTAVGQAGIKKKYSEKDKKNLKTCENKTAKKMESCLNKGKKVIKAENGKSKKSMIKLLEAQREMAVCNLNASIDAVKDYY
jgi:hypothetical protein